MTDKSKILLVDDDEVITETLRLVLEEEGYLVETASTGQEAISKSHEEFYNLAIVDWRLPDIEGTKVLRNFKETIPKMEKIMLTGYPSMQNAVDSVNARADAFFQKPVDMEVLLQKIKELLKLQEQERNFSEERMTTYIETRCKELAPKDQ